MAHHNSTSASVLNAPKLEARWFGKHTGRTRVMRRKYRTETGAVVTVPKASRRPATNVPYVKPKPAPVPAFGTELHELAERYGKAS